MYSVRTAVALVVSGLALLAACIVLPGLPVHADTPPHRSPAAPRYTNHPTRAETGRTLSIFVDRSFDNDARDRILLGIRQWNHVLNGFLQLRPVLLPDEPAPTALAQVHRPGSWFVARIDSRHPIASQPAVRQSLAITVGGSAGGYVYVIADRFSPRDLAGVLLHEIGHVLGAGHDERGHLMAPFYQAANLHCIDRQAAAMVAAAQHLLLSQLNWCEGPGLRDSQRSLSAASVLHGR